VHTLNQSGIERHRSRTKKYIQVVSAGLEDRLDEQSSQTNSILDELTSGVIVNRSEVDTNVNTLDERVDRLDREIHHVKDAHN
jgi:ABC-type phosphate transport system auxiliary subunit